MLSWQAFKSSGSLAWTPVSTEFLYQRSLRFEFVLITKYFFWSQINLRVARCSLNWCTVLTGSSVAPNGSFRASALLHCIALHCIVVATSPVHSSSDAGMEEPREQILVPLAVIFGVFTKDSNFQSVVLQSNRMFVKGHTT